MKEKSCRNKVFVLGDSISMHYGPYLKKMLNGMWDYDRKRDGDITINDLDQPVGGNGGDSSMIFKYIKEHYNELKEYDVLLLNCGLHDIKTDPDTKGKQISLEQYDINIRESLDLLIRSTVKTIWVRTTPVVDQLHNRIKGFQRFNKDVESYNHVADEIMKTYDIESIDLYSFTQNLGEDLHYDGVHFNENIRALQAAFIAGWLLHRA